MKKIILSYDYELFFGEQSGTVYGSIIHPTNLLLDNMNKNNLKGVFFVDYMMLKYLKGVGAKETNNDYRILVEQIQDIIKRGHRIELHIHPHWIDAKYNGDGTWDFSQYHHYSLSTFTKEEIETMFAEGKLLLETIAHQIDPSYTICAFRAGGWAIQPFDKIKSAFQKTGIRIDSSVAYMAHYECQYSKFDFRVKSLKNKSYYKFNNDVLLPTYDGEFVEVPITSFRRHVLYMGIDKIYKIFTNKGQPIADGSHLRNDLPPFKRNKYAMLGMDGRSPLSIILVILLSRMNLVTMISHPKDYTMSNEASLKWISKIAQSITYDEILKHNI